jgi:hypothetical protein
MNIEVKICLTAVVRPHIQLYEQRNKDINKATAALNPTKQQAVSGIGVLLP